MDSSMKPYQQLMVLFSNYIVALRDQEFPPDTQLRILSKTTAALTNIYTTEVLQQPRKRKGFYRTASTPIVSKKIPADQRIQLSAEELKRSKALEEKITSKLYTGISYDRWIQSHAKNGHLTVSSLSQGIESLGLYFNPAEVELLNRKFRAELEEAKIVDYNEFSELFPTKLKSLESEDKEEDDEQKGTTRDSSHRKGVLRSQTVGGPTTTTTSGVDSPSVTSSSNGEGEGEEESEDEDLDVLPRTPLQEHHEEIETE